MTSASIVPVPSSWDAPPSPLSGHDLIPSPRAPDEDGLDHPVELNRSNQILEFRVAEVLPGLPGVWIQEIESHLLNSPILACRGSDL